MIIQKAFHYQVVSFIVNNKSNVLLRLINLNVNINKLGTAWCPFVKSILIYILYSYFIYYVHNIIAYIQIKTYYMY